MKEKYILYNKEPSVKSINGIVILMITAILLLLILVKTYDVINIGGIVENNEIKLTINYPVNIDKTSIIEYENKKYRIESITYGEIYIVDNITYEDIVITSNIKTDKKMIKIKVAMMSILIRIVHLKVQRILIMIWIQNIIQKRIRLLLKHILDNMEIGIL